ncbi:MAG: hypothetical protein ACHQ52_15160, partial [Candidatus Eisenbacteria bacterium]
MRRTPRLHASALAWIPMLAAILLLVSARAPARADTACVKTMYFTRVDDRGLGDSTAAATGSLADQLGVNTARL